MSSLKYDFAHILLEKREELPQFMNFIGNLILVVCVCVCASKQHTTITSWTFIFITLVTSLQI